jgi:hypothetical protein
VSHLRRATAFASAALVAAIATGCAGPATTAKPAASARPGPSASPASAAPAASPTPPIPGLSWEKAPDVERPTDAFAEPSAEPTGPSGPGTAGHPGHFPGQAIVDDVVATDDGLTAVGYVGVDGVWTAIAWRSGDGGRWTLESIDEAPASFAVAVATDPRTGRVYAAGRTGPNPVVWAATGGGDWTRLGIPTLSGGAESERAVAIVATRDGLLVGGSVGRSSAIAGPGSGARPTAPCGKPSPTSRVRRRRGRRGQALPPAATSRSAISGPASGHRIAWRSDDGVAWRRVDDPALAGGLANALADADGSLVAVGSDLDEPGRSSGGRRTVARRGGGRRARTRGCTAVQDPNDRRRGDARRPRRGRQLRRAQYRTRRAGSRRAGDVDAAATAVRQADVASPAAAASSRPQPVASITTSRRSG